ncbi:MAG: hypothetical protein P8H03_00250, partial [Emcibacteraceae bacterium]|nr:hypothetical protein [Emcibacteraceae bacterium]
YINHGSFRCKLGTIAFGRTDSKLHNYFHYNPWSNPDENKLRAAAMMYRQRPELYKWTATHGHNHPHGPQDFEYKDYHMDTQVRHLHGDRDEPHHFRGEQHHNHHDHHPDDHGHSHADGHHHHHHDHDHD